MVVSGNGLLSTVYGTPYTGTAHLVSTVVGWNSSGEALVTLFLGLLLRLSSTSSKEGVILFSYFLG